MKAARLLPLLALLGLAVPGCLASPSEAHPIALRDPLGLIGCDAGETVGCVPAGALRLLVVPAGDYACSSDGQTSPLIPDAPVGDTADAVVDITVPVTAGAARQEVVIPAGDWVVLVRGNGVDPVTMVPNTRVASGCTMVPGFTAGETREIEVTVLPVSTGMGVCGDPVVSPDEQCEPPSTATCDASCHTLPYAANTTTAGLQENVALASRPGRRTLATWDTDVNARDMGLRVLDSNGRPVTSPSLLMNDIDSTTLSSLPVAQLGGVPAVAVDGHLAYALTHTMDGTNFDVRIFLMDENRNVTTANIPSRTDQTGVQDEPTIAFAGDGSLAVAFHDARSATGISITFFAPGATAPRADAIAAGSGTGGTSPSLTGSDTGFVLAYTSGGDVFYQRFAAAGTATDAGGVNVLTAPTGTQDQPAVAALPDGRFLVAWRDTDGDGMGTAIRARAFTAAAVGATPFTVNTTVTGDQLRPAVAAADSRYAIAFESAGSIRGRSVTDTGGGILNRERPPSMNDYEVAATGAAPAVTAVGSGSTAAWLYGWGASTDIFLRQYPR